MCMVWLCTDVYVRFYLELISSMKWINNVLKYLPTYTKGEKEYTQIQVKKDHSTVEMFGKMSQSKVVLEIHAKGFNGETEKIREKCERKISWTP